MGPRQTGKSTLVRRHPPLQEHLYLTLRLQTEEAPEALFLRGERLIGPGPSVGISLGEGALR